MPGFARETEGSSELSGQDAAGVYPRGPAQLGAVCQIGHPAGGCARRISHAHGAGFSSTPKEPAVLFMLRTPCRPGLPMREQYRAGRRELIDTPFTTFERSIRDQLGKMLGGGGFDPARDIEGGITVNRWAHG